MHREAHAFVGSVLVLLGVLLGSACDDSLSEPLDGSVVLADASTDADLPRRGSYDRPQVAPLALGDEAHAVLSGSAANFLFSFSLTASAKVSLRTQADDGGAAVDTVLTLSRIDQYGLPRAVGTSDDFDHTVFSGLDRLLSRGSYRISVRGATLATRGPFVLTSSCAGSGCPAPPASCLFGEQFSDLRTSSVLTIDSEVWITSEAELTSELMRDQVVLAVQQSAHTDVTTPADALAAVDQQEIRHMELSERNGTRHFTVYEYGAGDNSYGAIFVAGTLTIAASIHDGDLANCNVSL